MHSKNPDFHDVTILPPFYPYEVNVMKLVVMKAVSYSVKYAFCCQTHRSSDSEDLCNLSV